MTPEQQAAMRQALAQEAKDPKTNGMTSKEANAYLLCLLQDCAIALEQQPADKPFGYLRRSTARFVYDVEGANPMTDSQYLPLYTRAKPAAWVGLTDEEIEDIHCTPPRERPRGKFPFARMIEAKLREKNGGQP